MFSHWLSAQQNSKHLPRARQEEPGTGIAFTRAFRGSAPCLEFGDALCQYNPITDRFLSSLVDLLLHPKFNGQRGTLI
jgi:hypothetical protein